MYPLLTNINSQFIDSCGKPLAGGKVYTYEANTTTPKTTYADTEGLAVNTNPIILDESGRARIYMGDGSYRIRVLDRNEALIADTNKISRYVTNTELEVFIQTVEAGLSDLSQAKESLEVFAVAAINNQKGMPDGLAPLDANTKVDPLYLPAATALAAGVMKLNNTLASVSETQALTAAQGKVLNDQAFGVNQAWVNVRSTRLVNTLYTNDTNKPISVSIANPNVYWSEFSIVVGGVVIQSSVNNYQLPISIIFNVPVGATYRVNSGASGITGGVTAVWAELR